MITSWELFTVHLYFTWCLCCFIPNTHTQHFYLVSISVNYSFLYFHYLWCSLFLFFPFLLLCVFSVLHKLLFTTSCNLNLFLRATWFILGDAVSRLPSWTSLELTHLLKSKPDFSLLKMPFFNLWRVSACNDTLTLQFVHHPDDAACVRWAVQLCRPLWWTNEQRTLDRESQGALVVWKSYKYTTVSDGEEAGSVPWLQPTPSNTRTLCCVGTLFPTPQKGECHLSKKHQNLE